MSSTSGSTLDSDETPYNSNAELLERCYPSNCEEEEPSTSFPASEMVTLYIGPKHRRYKARKSLLTAKSPYFKRCLKPNFTEGQTLTVNLEHDPVGGFDHFVEWVYKGVVSRVLRDEYSRQATIEAWALADKWDMQDFQNCLMETYKQFHREHTTEATDLLYASQLGLEDSKLGDYLFDQLAYAYAEFPETQFKPKTHMTSGLALLVEARPGIAVKLIRSLSEGEWKSGKEPANEKRCKYHVHPPDHHPSDCKAKSA